MKNKDVETLKKIIGYCDDVETLMNKYNSNFEQYKMDISFQYMYCTLIV